MLEHYKGTFRLIYDDLGLAWWRIWGYGSDTCREGKRFALFEKQGKYGLCISDESPFETKLIRKWLVTNLKTDFYWGRVEYCDHFNELIGPYYVCSRCIWIPKENYDAFNAFMNTIPKRTQLYACGQIDPIIKGMLKGKNYKIITGTENFEGYSALSAISVETIDNPEKLQVMLAITR